MPQKERTLLAELVFRSRTGSSLLEDAAHFTSASLPMYQADEDSAMKAVRKLKRAGFKVVAQNSFGASITGPAELFETYFKTKVGEHAIEMPSGGAMGKKRKAFFMAETPRLPGDLSAMAEHVYIPKPGQFYAGEGAMPTPSYYHLRPPADIAQLTNATHAHARGFRGSGVKLAMIDSGFIASHDYYSTLGYNITVQAATGSTTQDEVGHGTGIATNLLAIAPDSDFHFYKMYDGSNWASHAAFTMAVADGVKVITCSWGQPFNALLKATIQSAVASGITVIFACGNGGAVGWPGCMPEVISIGGAFPHQNGTWEASSYASSGTNGLEPGRLCPDLSSIVGQSPSGIFIVMPTMKNADFDNQFGGGTHPNGDETAGNDGWLVASGTSSAAPMVAGAAGLLLEAKPSLTPTEVRNTLMNTCVDVVQGVSASGDAAGIGTDDATGTGRLDVGAAIDAVAPVVCRTAPYVECLTGPVCSRAPHEVCGRAPYVECFTGPVCSRAPHEVCGRAPYVECLTGPVCSRAPIECARGPVCARAPYFECSSGPVCSRAPHQVCTRPPACTRGPGTCVRGPELCSRAPVDVCSRAPQVECLRGPVCSRAPAQVCTRAPVVECAAGPNCSRAPLYECAAGPNCSRAPAVVCDRAPIAECAAGPACNRAPAIACSRAPIYECGRAPSLECGRAPSLECGRAPTMEGCLAGPWKRDPWERVGDPWEREREPIEGRLVPVVVMVSEDQAAAWAGEDAAYFSELERLGMADEYGDFPNTGGCGQGPFDPSVKR